MSKKRKKEDEEDEDFSFPEFDRVEYMKKEINKGKSVLVTIAIAPLFSYISFKIFEFTMEWTLGFLMFFLGIYILGPVHKQLRIKVEEFGWKEYAMNWAMFFFTWLIVWIILMNPPFGDFTDPTLEHVRIGVLTDQENNTWGHLDDVELVNGESYTINVTAKITDNVDIHKDSVSIEFQGNFYPMTPVDEHTYRIVFEDVTARTNEYIFTVYMEDVNGHGASEVVERTIGN